MKIKFRLSLFLSILLLVIAFSISIGKVHAEDKTISEPRMAIGSSVSSDNIPATKRLLGNESLSDSKVISITGDMLATYVPEADRSLDIVSSVYIQPMSKGYGVKVEIVTPDTITKVSSSTYENAVITSGASDVLVRIGAVSSSTGESALAGIYALLNQYGIAITNDVVSASQNEVKIVQSLKDEAKLSDAQANRWLGKLKKSATKKGIKDGSLSDDNLKGLIDKAVTKDKLSLSQTLQDLILAWLKAYMNTDVAKSKRTIRQLEKSILKTDWKEELAGLDKSYSRDELLKMKAKDYSDNSKYHAIINALYQYLILMIRNNKVSSVKEVYSHTFVIEKILGNLTSDESSAITEMRKLCYYYISWKEDKQLKASNTSTKQEFLSRLDAYEGLNKTPSLKEIINRISIATGESYEVYPFVEFSQDGDILHLVIDGLHHITVDFNLSSGDCSYEIDGKKYRHELYDFNKVYKVKVKNKYQSIVESFETFHLTEDSDKTSTSSIQDTRLSAYSDEQILAAKVWCTITDGTYPFIYSRKEAGTPVDYSGQAEEKFPNVTYNLVADPSNYEMQKYNITYEDNGDGTVKVYSLPRRWFPSTEEESKELARNILNHTETLKIRDDIDTALILSVLENNFQ